MKHLEDIMDYYAWNGDGVVTNEPLAPNERERILEQTFLKAGLAPAKQGEPTPSSSTKPAGAVGRTRRKTWILAAACILILAMATVSFAAIALNKNLLDFFSPQNQQQIDTLNNSGVVINREVTNNGLTLKVKEAVGDGNSVFILFDLIAPADTVLDADYYQFLTALVSLPSAHGGAGYYFEQLTDDNSKDNRISMMLCYSAESNLSGKKMKFSFSDFSILKTAEEIAAIEALPPRTEPGTPGDAYDYSKILISGTWELTFPLEYQDQSITVKSNADVSLFGGTCKIKEIRYSPISVSMVIKGDAIGEYDKEPPATTAQYDTEVSQTLQDMKTQPPTATAQDSAPQEIQVLLKDGSTVPINSSNRAISGNKLSLTCQLSQVIDPADIASIAYGGTVIPIE